MRLLSARKGLIALAIAGISAVGLVGSAPSATAATRLGGVDMQRACSVQWKHFGPVTAFVRDQRNAFSWTCKSNYTGVIVGGIDVNRQCVDQYGRGAYAGLGSTSNPYSWYCQR
jgi:hypothetical protein